MSYLCSKMSKTTQIILHFYLRRYPLTLSVIAVVLCLSLMPIPEAKHLRNIPLMDKWTHMVMYGTLTLVLWLELRRAHPSCGMGRLLLAFFGPIALGGTLELAQAYLTTYRSGEWLDFVANTIGVCLGTVVAWTVVRLFPKWFRR